LNFERFEADNIDQCVEFIQALIERSANVNGVSIEEMRKGVKIMATDLCYPTASNSQPQSDSGFTEYFIIPISSLAASTSPGIVLSGVLHDEGGYDFKRAVMEAIFFSSSTMFTAVRSSLRTSAARTGHYAVG
jgi:hypothetical protein